MDQVYKKTPARKAIIKSLSGSTTPLDVSALIKLLRAQNLNTNKVTVYRNIEDLYKRGLLVRLDFGEGKFRYEIKKEHHHHLICTNCGAVEDVKGEYLDVLEDQVKRENGFEVSSHSLEFFGLCRNCQN